MLVKDVCKELDDNYPGNWQCRIKIDGKIYEIDQDAESAYPNKIVYLVAIPFEGVKGG